MDLLSNQPPSSSQSTSKGVRSFQQYRSKVKERTLSSMLPLRFVQNPNPKDLSNNSNWCSIDSKRQLLSSRTSHSSTLNLAQSNQTTPIHLPSPSFLTDRQMSDGPKLTSRKKSSNLLFPSSSSSFVINNKPSKKQYLQFDNSSNNSQPPASFRLLDSSLKHQQVIHGSLPYSFTKQGSPSIIKANDLINNQATTTDTINALFHKQEILLQNTKNLSENVKQIIIGLNQDNAQQNAGNENRSNILSLEMKQLLFSTVDKLEKLILEKGRINFYDKLIPESIELLNSLIPTVIRQLANFDSDLSRICEGLYSFVLVFLDQIQQRIQINIKKEYSQKLNNDEVLINEQKNKIAALQKEMVTQKLRNVQDRLAANGIENKLKVEIKKLTSQISALQEDLSELELQTQNPS